MARAIGVPPHNEAEAQAIRLKAAKPALARTACASEARLRQATALFSPRPPQHSHGNEERRDHQDHRAEHPQRQALFHSLKEDADDLLVRDTKFE